MSFSFEFIKPLQNSRARLGKITTPHGVIETPAFIFCATKAAIKGLTPLQMKEAGTQVILSNTYHLMLQPGSGLIQEMGGLHKFMNWDGPTLTDSGGFQIFSLGHGSVAQEIKGNRQTANNKNKNLLKITEEGALFKSYLDGSTHLLTPEKSIQVQKELGADLIVVLDECTPFHVDKDYTRSSMEMSHRWAARSYAEFKRHDNNTQSLYGIIQGGVYEDLRKESCDFVNSQPFFGHAIGGSLGANKEQMAEVITMTARRLDEKRPVHLLGIGGIKDIIKGVENGIDTFDCVHPTRIARHGGALVKGGDENGRDHINLHNSKYKTDKKPIENDCNCYTCSNFSRAYLKHLLKSQELLGLQLITIHNVHFMNRLMAEIRENLKAKLGVAV
jgi:queuine tRNA-ribosyltransferase